MAWISTVMMSCEDMVPSMFQSHQEGRNPMVPMKDCMFLGIILSFNKYSQSKLLNIDTKGQTQVFTL